MDFSRMFGSYSNAGPLICIISLGYLLGCLALYLSVTLRQNGVKFWTRVQIKVGSIFTLDLAAGRGEEVLNTLALRLKQSGTLSADTLPNTLVKTQVKEPGAAPLDRGAGGG